MAKLVRPWIRFTYQDYKSLPESETKRYELLDGALLMTPSPTTNHQRIVGKIHVALVQHVETHQNGEVYLSPIDVILGEDVVQPDILSEISYLPSCHASNPPWLIISSYHNILRAVKST